MRGYLGAAHPWVVRVITPFDSGYLPHSDGSLSHSVPVGLYGSHDAHHHAQDPSYQRYKKPAKATQIATPIVSVQSRTHPACIYANRLPWSALTDSWCLLAPYAAFTHPSNDPAMVASPI